VVPKSPSRYSKRLANKSSTQNNTYQPPDTFLDEHSSDSDKENYDIFPSEPISLKNKLSAGPPNTQRPRDSILLTQNQGRRKLVACPKNTPKDGVKTYPWLKSKNPQQFSSTPQAVNKKQVSSVFGNKLGVNNKKLMTNPLISNSNNTVATNIDNLNFDSPLRLSKNLEVNNQRKPIDTTLAMIAQTGNHVSLLSSDSNKSSSTTKNDLIDEDEFNESHPAPILPVPKKIVNKNIQKVQNLEVPHTFSMQNLNQTIQNNVKNLPGLLNDTITKACNVASVKIGTLTKSLSWNFFQFPTLKGRKMIREIDQVDSQLNRSLNVSKKHSRRRANATGEFSSNDSQDQNSTIHSNLSISSKTSNHIRLNDINGKKIYDIWFVILVFFMILGAGVWYKFPVKVEVVSEPENVIIPTIDEQLSVEPSVLELKLTDLEFRQKSFESQILQKDQIFKENLSNIMKMSQSEKCNQKIGNLENIYSEKFNKMEVTLKNYEDLFEIFKHEVFSKFEKFDLLYKSNYDVFLNQIERLNNNLQKVENRVEAIDFGKQNLQIQVENLQDKFLEIETERKNLIMKETPANSSQIELSETILTRLTALEAKPILKDEPAPKSQSLTNLLNPRFASINYKRTSPTNKKNKLKLTFMGIPIFYDYNSPEIILENSGGIKKLKSLDHGDCWSAKLPAKLSFNLNLDIEIAGFSITFMKNSRQSPRKLKICGANDGDHFYDKNELIYIDLQQGSDQDLLNKFETKFYDVNNIQKYRYLEIDVIENFSRDDVYTCFYNVGVYGRVI